MAGPFLWEILAASCVEEVQSFQLKQSLCSVDIFPYISVKYTQNKQISGR